MMKMRRLNPGGAIFSGLLFIISVAALAETALVSVEILPVTAETANDTCLECHGVEGFAVPEGETGESLKRGLHVKRAIYENSIHAREPCVSCHADIEQMPHKKGVKRTVDCIGCHEEQDLKERDQTQEQVDFTRSLTHSMVGLPSTITLPKQSEVVMQAGEYLASIHAQPHKDSPGEINANCWDCHGEHDVFPQESPYARTYRLTTPETCGACHEEQLRDYAMSVHGAPVSRFGDLEPAVCSDCHTAHRIARVEDDPAKLTITENCGGCHEDYYESYRDTYHGQVARLGYAHTAKCYNCHAHHKTRKADDPASLVHKDNRLETCRECHKQATAGFVSFEPHGNTHDFDRYPQMWITSKFMIGLLSGVFLFFWTHCLLWFYREYEEHKRDHVTVRLDENGAPLKQRQYVQRFSRNWRIAHLVLVIAVMILVLTGTTVLFADSFWAPTVMKLLGGPKIAAIVHRMAAFTFGIVFFGHIAVILYNIFVVKRGKFDWFGSDSLLPRIQDWQDFMAMVRWFFGKGERPVFDRWTYWEKFDYWAPFWGMFIIGLSGLTLWFPNLFAQFLPGWVFNVATIIHGEEAFLAAVFLFTVHFFNSHFRPEKFPLDVIMFTGTMTLEEFTEERRVEYERLVTEDRLKDYLVGAPTAKMAKYSKILGFTLLAIGLIELLLVISGFLQDVIG